MPAYQRRMSASEGLLAQPSLYALNRIERIDPPSNSRGLLQARVTKSRCHYHTEICAVMQLSSYASKQYIVFGAPAPCAALPRLCRARAMHCPGLQSVFEIPMLSNMACAARRWPCISLSWQRLTASTCLLGCSLRRGVWLPDQSFGRLPCVVWSLLPSL